jgi:hypothetical protein
MKRKILDLRFKISNRLLHVGLLLLCVVRIQAAEPMTILDCRKENLPLNPPAAFTLVLQGTPSLEKELRDFGAEFDDQLVRTDFRLIVVVDLSRHPGRFLPDTVRGQMRANLARKREILKTKAILPPPKQEFAMYSAPDFDGAIVKQLGFKGDTSELRVVLYSSQAEEPKRWTHNVPADEIRKLLR